MRGQLGTSLIVVGLTGFAALQAAPRLPATVVEPLSAFIERETPTPRHLAAADSHVTTAQPALERTDITRLVIPSIDLDTAVAPAPLVDRNGVSTWDVPRFVAGHAEGSAGAGKPGNAILIGHITSITMGNVFEHLDGVAPGVTVEVFSFEKRFDYRVSEVRDVARTDVAVLDPTPTPSVTLITCSGLWLPTIWDYTQRLVVRAELMERASVTDVR